MATKGSSGLNRIFRVTATLLFEKGESMSNIARLMEGFVEPRLIRVWHEKWSQVSANPSKHTVNGERLPVPPIDWDAIKLQDLKAINETGNRLAGRVESGQDREAP
jgi:hypothetical protein